MKNSIFLRLASLFVAVLSLTGCTLSDPYEGKNGTDDSSSLKLSYITMYGTTVSSISYDSKGRVTALDLRYTSGYIANVDYNNNTFTMHYYDEGSYGDNLFETERIVLSEINFNSDGFIENCIVRDYSLNSDGDWALDNEYNEDQQLGVFKDFTNATFTYDSNGHLTRIDQEGEATIFTWKDGNLITYEDDGDISTFTYSSSLNKRNQWSPMWGCLGYMMTGIFGNAPTNLVSSITSPDGTNTFAYQLSSAGYIEKEQTKIDDTQIVLTYNYKTIK